MLDKEQIRMLALAERLMDEGEISWVWMMANSGQYERLAVNEKVMEELGLVQGQTINTIIMDAIARESIRILTEEVEMISQKAQDSLLDEDFDFRKEMNDE